MRNAKLQIKEWETWQEFKDQIEAEVGFYIPVYVWLEIRPKRPLPWNEGDYRTLIARISSSSAIRVQARS